MDLLIYKNSEFATDLAAKTNSYLVHVDSLLSFQFVLNLFNQNEFSSVTFCNCFSSSKLDNAVVISNVFSRILKKGIKNVNIIVDLNISYDIEPIAYDIINELNIKYMKYVIGFDIYSDITSMFDYTDGLRFSNSKDDDIAITDLNEAVNIISSNIKACKYNNTETCILNGVVTFGYIIELMAKINNFEGEIMFGNVKPNKIFNYVPLGKGVREIIIGQLPKNVIVKKVEPSYTEWSLDD